MSSAAVAELRPADASIDPTAHAPTPKFERGRDLRPRRCMLETTIHVVDLQAHTGDDDPRPTNANTVKDDGHRSDKDSQQHEDEDDGEWESGKRIIGYTIYCDRGTADK